MKLIIISDSGGQNTLIRRPTLMPVKMAENRKHKHSKKKERIYKPKKFNISKIHSIDRITRSSRSITKPRNNMLNLPASHGNQHDSINPYIRDDPKLLKSFVILERIDVYNLRTTNLYLSEQKLSNDFRTTFYSTMNNDCSNTFQRTLNNNIKGSELECCTIVKKLPNRGNTTVAQGFIERVPNDTLHHTEEPAKSEDKMKIINEWTLRFETSAKGQLSIEGYIDGGKKSKVPVICRLTSRKFRSVNKEIFYLQGNICDPDYCIPMALKSKFKEGLPRCWRSQLTNCIRGVNEVPQESAKSRYENPTIQTSNNKMSIHLDSGQLSTFTGRRSSSQMKNIFQNSNKRLRSNSHPIYKQIVKQSSELREKREANENANPVAHRTQHLEKECSNSSGIAKRLRGKREANENANSVAHKTQHFEKECSNSSGSAKRLHGKRKTNENSNPVAHKMQHLKKECSNSSGNAKRLRGKRGANDNANPVAQKTQNWEKECSNSSGNAKRLRVKRGANENANPVAHKSHLEKECSNSSGIAKRLRGKREANENANSVAHKTQHFEKECSKSSGNAKRLHGKRKTNENSNPVAHKMQHLKKKSSNSLGNSKNLPVENEMKAQTDGIDNIKIPKTLKERKKLKATLSKLVETRKVSMDLFEDEEDSELLRDETSENEDPHMLWDIDWQTGDCGSQDISSLCLATTPAKLMDLRLASTPTLSPASSYCNTPRISYAENYIHRQLKKRKEYKKKTVNPAVLQPTKLNSSSQEKGDEAYEALIGGKDLPKYLFQFNHRLERSGSTDISDESNL